jgi:DNA-binding transcriptional LysR family regulator
LVSVIPEMHKETKMDLRQLEVFINLAESLNYSKTAENLHLSQPAVSRIIQRIEGEVGVTLFYPFLKNYLSATTSNDLIACR